jgi:hypothetical protein
LPDSLIVPADFVSSPQLMVATKFSARSPAGTPASEAASTVAEVLSVRRERDS